MSESYRLHFANAERELQLLALGVVIIDDIRSEGSQDNKFYIERLVGRSDTLRQFLERFSRSPPFPLGVDDWLCFLPVRAGDPARLLPRCLLASFGTGIGCDASDVRIVEHVNGIWQP